MASVDFVEKMRAMAIQARESLKENRENDEDWREKKKQADIEKFFEMEVMKGAVDKMEKRAEKGCYSANILEYHFNEFFYISKKGDIVRIPEFKQIPGYYVHRIHNAVKEEFFQEKLRIFVKSLSSEMQYDCWYPGRDKINVITLFWGPTRTHKWELVWGPADQMSDVTGSTRSSTPIDQSEETTEEKAEENAE